MPCCDFWLWKAPMLKISVVERQARRSLVVEGKLIGPWAAELKSACEKANADLDGRDLLLDVRHLTAISQEGENVLLELMSNGVKFRCRGVFTKHVLKELSRRAAANLRETNQ